MSNILGLNGAPLGINGAPIAYDAAGTDTSDATISSNSQLLYPYTSYGNGIKYTGSIPSLGATTYYPSTSDQTIAAARYLSGVQTIKGLAVSNNLIASNIKNGVTVTIGDSDDDDRILSVTGTYDNGAYWTKVYSGTFSNINYTSTSPALYIFDQILPSNVTYTGRFLRIRISLVGGPVTDTLTNSDIMCFISSTSNIQHLISTYAWYNGSTYNYYYSTSTSGYGFSYSNISYSDDAWTCTLGLSATTSFIINGNYLFQTYISPIFGSLS